MGICMWCIHTRAHLVILKSSAPTEQTLLSLLVEQRKLYWQVRRIIPEHSPAKDHSYDYINPTEWIRTTEQHFCQRKMLLTSFIILPKTAHHKKPNRNSRFVLAKWIFHLQLQTKVQLLPNIVKLHWGCAWKTKSSDCLKFYLMEHFGLFPLNANKWLHTTLKVFKLKMILTQSCAKLTQLWWMIIKIWCYEVLWHLQTWWSLHNFLKTIQKNKVWF